MLPFLRNKVQGPGGVITQNRTPDGGQEPEKSNDNEGLSVCAADLIAAIHAKDEPGTAAALRAAYDILNAQDEPSSDEHQEGQL